MTFSAAFMQIGTLLRSRLVRIAFLVAAVIAAILVAVAERDRVSDGLSRVNAAELATALGFSLLYLLCAALSWRSLLSELGSDISVRSVARVFFLSLIGKYLPGGIGSFVAAAELGHDAGLTRKHTVSSFLIALMLALITGTLIAFLLLPISGEAVFARYWWAGLAVLPAVAVLHPAVLRQLLALARIRIDGVLKSRGILTASAWAAAGWLMAGAQLWLLATAIGAPFTLPTLVLAIGGYALAWVVGVLVLISPAGFGPREATLTFVLTTLMPPGEALVVALLSRLVMTAAEFVLAALTLAMTRRATGPADLPRPA